MAAEDEDDDCLTFHETRQEKRVRLLNSDAGTMTNYVVREMMGDGVEEWTKFRVTRMMKGSKGGKPDLKSADFKDFTATLVSYCLFTEDDKPVPVDVIAKWPASTLNGLYDLCETMNGLNDEGKERAKKV